MALKEKIEQDLNEAVKKKYEVNSLVLRQLLAVILNKEKEKRFKINKEKSEISEEDLGEESRLTDEEIIEVIFSEVKKGKEAISEFEKGERRDLVEKEKKELEILQKYLPEQLLEEEIEELAKETIERIGAKEAKDMGKVMTELIPQVKGRAEGGVVSKIVKELLEK